MLAYEFQAAINNGFIKIPVEYTKKMPINVKVILLSEETDEQPITDETEQKVSFPYFAVDTTGYIFNREEANER